MPRPGEHKTVQARILTYAQEIGWVFVQRGEAERRRGFDTNGATPEARARHTLYAVAPTDGRPRFGSMRLNSGKCLDR